MCHGYTQLRSQGSEMSERYGRQGKYTEGSECESLEGWLWFGWDGGKENISSWGKTW